MTKHQRGQISKNHDKQNEKKGNTNENWRVMET